MKISIVKNPEMVISFYLKGKYKTAWHPTAKSCFNTMVDLYDKYPENDFKFQVFAEVKPEATKKKVTKKKGVTK